MRYRIVTNGVGKYKVQSSPMGYTFWRALWSALRPLAWHDRGKDPSTNCHSLNWRGEEYDTLTEAQASLQRCREYDLRAAKENNWILVWEG